MVLIHRRRLVTRLSETVFLCRWHPGQSPEEPGWAAADAVWMWWAEHGTSGPQHLHPPVPEKHTAADPSHQGKVYQLPDQRWVSVGFILQLKRKHLGPSNMPTCIVNSLISTFLLLYRLPETAELQTCWRCVQHIWIRNREYLVRTILINHSHRIIVCTWRATWP